MVQVPDHLLEYGGHFHGEPPWLVLSLGFGGLLLCIIVAAGTLLAVEWVRGDEAQGRKAFLERRLSENLRARINLQELSTTGLTSCRRSTSAAFRN